MEEGRATRWATRALGALAVGVTMFGTGVEHSSAAKKRGRSRPVTVMARNVYLGADIRPALVAIVANPDAVPQVLGKIWRDVESTNIELRAEALAAEIAETRPHLVGVQEAAVWRTQFPSDATTANPTPAENVVYDFVASVRRKLKRRGLRYRIAVAAAGADFERAIEREDGSFEDVRLTIRDLILVRAGFRVRKAQAANFDANLVLPFDTGPVPLLRQWASVDFRRGGRRVRFISTHLEDNVEIIQAFQARELLAWPADTDMPVILVGDLNSDPTLDYAPAPYWILAAAGFQDTWLELRPEDPGKTGWQLELLDNEVSNLTHRIDYVLTRGPLEALSADLVGEDEEDRIGGLWPSDHAGVVVDVEVQRE